MRLAIQEAYEEEDCEALKDMAIAQDKKIQELKDTLSSLGYCIDCDQVRQHDVYEPFSHCDCGTSEDDGGQKLQALQIVARNAKDDLKSLAKAAKPVWDWWKIARKYENDDIDSDPNMPILLRVDFDQQWSQEKDQPRKKAKVTARQLDQLCQLVYRCI